VQVASPKFGVTYILLLRILRSMFSTEEAIMFGLSKRESILYASVLALGLMLTGWGLHHLINNSGNEIVNASNLVSNGQASAR